MLTNDHDEHDEPLLKQDLPGRIRTGTFFGSVANLLNNAIGSGVLVFPYAFGQTGVILGVLLSGIFACILGVTYHIVGRCQFQADANTYQDLVFKVLGERGLKLALVTQLLFLVGACVAYLVVVSDQILHSLGDDHAMSKTYIVIPIVAFCLCMPLMFIKNIQKLSFLSTISLFSVMYTTVVLLVRSAHQLSEHGMPEPVNGNPTSDGEFSTFRHSVDIVRSIPVFAFSFMLHPSYCLVLDEMKDRRLKTMDKAVSITLVACVFFYAMYGCFGYMFCARFADFQGLYPPQDILNAFPANWYDIAVARLGMSVSVISSFVALHFGARTVIQDLFLPKGGQFNKKEFVLEIVIFLVLTSLIAIAVPGVGTVIEFSAGTTVVALQFCFPGAFMVALAAKENKAETTEKRNNKVDAKGVVEQESGRRGSTGAGAGAGAVDTAACTIKSIVGWALIAFGIAVGCTCVTVSAMAL